MRGMTITFFLVLRLACGQTSTWEQLISSGAELRAQARYREAEIAFRSALEQAAAPGKLGRSLNDLAVVLRARENMEAAFFAQSRTFARGSLRPRNSSAGGWAAQGKVNERQDHGATSCGPN